MTLWDFINEVELSRDAMTDYLEGLKDAHRGCNEPRSPQAPEYVRGFLDGMAWQEGEQPDVRMKAIQK